MVLKMPEFEINKDEPSKGIEKLLQLVKPSWDVKTVTTEDVIGGFSSKMFKCFPKENPKDIILIRLQCLMDLPVFQEWKGPFEVQVIEYLSTIGHFAEIHAIFSNGYCYQYIEGNPAINLRRKTGDLTDEIVKAIAYELAFIHSIKIPNVDYNEQSFFAKMKITIEKSNFQNKHKSMPSKEVILKEFELLDKYYKSLDTPITLCHGDTHPGNFVWNDKTKKITFVDWELTRIGYQYQDLAYFLTTLKSISPEVMPEMKVKMTDKIEEKFLAWYYEAWSKLNGVKPISKDFPEFGENVKKFMLCPLLAGITFSIIIPDILKELEGGKDDGESMFLEKTLGGYLEMKQLIFGRKQFG